MPMNTCKSHLLVITASLLLLANKYDLVMGDENLRAVTKLETMKFASENDLLYIGESSALADINIKEVVETLMEKIHEM